MTTDSLNPITLLPCPHCGEGESMVECYKNDNGYWSVGCGRCGAHSGSLPDTAYKDAKERVIKGWNKRAQPSEIPEDTNKLCEAQNAYLRAMEPVAHGEIPDNEELRQLVEKSLRNAMTGKAYHDFELESALAVDALLPYLRTTEPVMKGDHNE